MIYTSLTKKAIKLMFNAHKEQIDKSGLPYVFHPFHVAESMDDEYSTVVALLHDVVEDTDITFTYLEKEFPKEVIEALKLLTHDQDVDYYDYVREIKKNPIAKKVKMSDLKHNMDLSRLDEVNEYTYSRLEKYKKALNILNEEYKMLINQKIKELASSNNSMQREIIENTYKELEEEKIRLNSFIKITDRLQSFLSEYNNASSSLYQAKKQLSYINDEQFDELNEKFNEFINKYELSGRVEVIDNETIIYMNGKIAHAAMPELGKNALSYLLMFISENFDDEVVNHYAKLFSDYYGEGMGINIDGERMGKLTMNLGLGTFKNNEYSFTINIRYPIDTTGEKVKEVLDSKVLDEGKLVSDSHPLYVDPNSPFIKTLLKAYQDISGDLETLPMTIGGGTYARNTINSVAFGMCFPNEEELAHQVNEVLSVESLEVGLAIYLEAIHLLGGL